MRIIPTIAIAAIFVAASTLAVVGQEPPKTEPMETPAVTGTVPTDEEKKMPAAEMEAKGPPIITASEIKNWIGLPVYSNDGKEIGKVNKVVTEDDGSLRGIQIECGGYFGFFTTTVFANPDQFEKEQNKIALKLSEEQAKQLPQPKS